MARWKLTSGHYILIEGEEWEYVEQSIDTGRPVRKRFIVPKYLNPDHASDHNYPGEIIISNAPNGLDYVFSGPPTPDMLPLDEEAEALSDAERPKWIHPIESLPGQGFSQSLLTHLERMFDQASLDKPLAPVSTKGVDPAEFAALQEQVAAMMAMNAELQQQLAERRT